MLDLYQKRILKRLIKSKKNPLERYFIKKLYSIIKLPKNYRTIYYSKIINGLHDPYLNFCTESISSFLSLTHKDWYHQDTRIKEKIFLYQIKKHLDGKLLIYRCEKVFILDKSQLNSPFISDFYKKNNKRFFYGAYDSFILCEETNTIILLFFHGDIYTILKYSCNDKNELIIDILKNNRRITISNPDNID